MRTILLLVAYFLINTLSAQNFVQKVTLKTKDTLINSENVIITKNGLYSPSSSKIYEYISLEEITIEKEKKLQNFYVIQTNLYYNSDLKPKIGIGYKVYDSEKLELFHVVFGDFSKSLNHLIHQSPLEYNPNFEIFIRKKGEKAAFSMGIIDGAGWEDIDRRLWLFFSDCPKFFEHKKKLKIRDKHIIKLAELYNSTCE